MPLKKTQADKRLARQLDRATYAALNSRAISEEAKALVGDVSVRVAAWEQKSSGRTYKRHTRAHKFRDALEAFTADLVRAKGDAIAKGWVYRSLHAKSFTGQRVSHRNFVSLVEGLGRLGLLEQRRGFQGTVNFGTGPVVARAKASRFRATSQFVELAKRYGVDPSYAVDHFIEDLPEHPLLLRAASTRSYFTGEKIKGHNLPFSYTPRVRAIEDDVKELNTFLRQFDIQGALHQYYVRIFNEGDDKRFRWNLGGRLYSPGKTSYQQVDRDKRLAMTINGEPVCEIDISASYLTIFLGWHELQIKLGEADPYAKSDLDKEDRDAVKQWFVATFGSGDLVTKWSRDAVSDFRKNMGKDLRKVDADRIRQAAARAYPTLERWRDDRRTWADLMWSESEAVIAAMLSLKREHKVPSLTVHDSLLVPLSERRLAEWQMSVCYKRATGVQPILRTKALHEDTSTPEENTRERKRG